MSGGMTHQDAGQPACAAPAKNDEIGLEFQRRVDDFLMGLVAIDQLGGAIDPRRFGGGDHGIQGGLGRALHLLAQAMGANPFQVLGGEDDGHGGEPCAAALGQGDGNPLSADGEFGAVGSHEDAFQLYSHDSDPLCQAVGHHALDQGEDDGEAANPQCQDQSGVTQ